MASRVEIRAPCPYDLVRGLDGPNIWLGYDQCSGGTGGKAMMVRRSIQEAGDKTLSQPILLLHWSLAVSS